MDGVIGVVTCFAADFAPRNWATCDGQLLAISQNQALFSILGTTYGGDGVTNFALPDFRGRTAVGTGNGALGNFTAGQVAGTETVTLNVNNLPPHKHDGELSLALKADSSEGSVKRSTNTFPAAAENSFSATANDKMAEPSYTNTVIGNNSGGQPFSVRMPFLAVNYIICLYGIYPSRN